VVRTLRREANLDPTNPMVNLKLNKKLSGLSSIAGCSFKLRIGVAMQCDSDRSRIIFDIVARDWRRGDGTLFKLNASTVLYISRIQECPKIHLLTPLEFKCSVPRRHVLSLVVREKVTYKSL
jgi:hypothetical protein